MNLAHLFKSGDPFWRPLAGDRAVCGWQLPGVFSPAKLMDPRCPVCLAIARADRVNIEHIHGR